MAKKRSKRRTPQKRGKPSAAQMLDAIATRPPAASEQAREAALQHYDAALIALDEGAADLASREIRAAVDADPRYVNALELYAELASGGPKDLLAALRVVERVARSELGEATFSEDRGHFWGLIETRPYMQLKNRIANLLQNSGDAPAAMAEYEEMLALNPNDNQGVRDPLLGLYLASGALERADALMRDYHEDASAVMRWGRLLWLLLDGETGEAAEQALADAQAANVFVAPLLLGALEPPIEMPGVYTPGGANEAVIVVDCLAGGWWGRDPGPLEWLASRVWL